MLEPISREDAQKILRQMFPDEELLPTLDPKQNFGHEEPLLSQTAALVCAWRAHQRNYTPAPPEERPSPEELLSSVRRVVHAGGYIDNPLKEGKKTSYTNSVEALVNAYCQGARIIEMDITKTSDGHLACIHDWLHEVAPAIEEGVPLTLEQWLGVKVYRSFSPVCLESLADFMRQHRDLYIVTDVKDSNVEAMQIIADTCPDLRERFLVQIYSEDEYDRIKELGFPNMIFTLYNLSKQKRLDTDHLTEFAAGHPLLAFTYNASLLDREGYTKAMRKAGIPLCVHTLNDDEEIQRAYDMGITAVYTDRVD